MGISWPTPVQALRARALTIPQDAAPGQTVTCRAFRAMSDPLLSAGPRTRPSCCPSGSPYAITSVPRLILDRRCAFRACLQGGGEPHLRPAASDGRDLRLDLAMRHAPPLR